MSFLVAGSVAGLYVGGLFSLHRFRIHQLRKQAGSFETLQRLDWEELLRGVRPALGQAVEAGVGPEEIERMARASGAFESEVRWLITLAWTRADPEGTWEKLGGSPASVGELYLREYLRLRYRTDAVNLELSAWGSRVKLARGIRRFGHRPALYLARALASAHLGALASAIDDLGRAVYFAEGSRFYLKTVVDWPYVEEARPALAFQCRRAWEEGGGPSLPRSSRGP